jgi:cytochrome c-type biogenesis protein CcmH
MASTGWKQLKQRGAAWAVLGAVAVALLVIGVSNDSGPRTPEERVEEISKRLACPICDGESIFESRNNASVAIKNEIRAQVADGVRSDDEIITFVVQRYQSEVLLVPRADGVDALVWILPVVASVCAVAGLAVAFRRWRAAADDIPSDDDRELVAAALAADAAEPVRVESAASDGPDPADGAGR